MPGQLQNPQTTLNYLYGIYNAALVALASPQSDVVEYEIGDRRVQVRSFEDLIPLQKLIQMYESIVVSDVTVLPFMGGPSNAPGPLCTTGQALVN